MFCILHIVLFYVVLHISSFILSVVKSVGLDLTCEMEARIIRDLMHRLGNDAAMLVNVCTALMGLGISSAESYRKDRFAATQRMCI